MTESLTVTLTVKLEGPTAVEAAQSLLVALNESEALTESTFDGLTVRAEQEAPIVIDTISRKIAVDGVVCSFTNREFDLLLYLADHPGVAVTRLHLMRTVWGYEHSGERTVDVHIRRIRTKLAEHGHVITTVHGFGYRLDHPERISIRRQERVMSGVT